MRFILKSMIILATMSFFTATARAQEVEVYAYVNFRSNPNMVARALGSGERACERGFYSIVNSEPIEATLERINVNSDAMKYEFLSWLYDNHKGDLDLVAKTTLMRSGTVIWATTKEAALEKAKNYGFFNVSSGCSDARLIQIDPTGFIYTPETPAKRFGIGEDRFQFLREYFNVLP